MAEDLGLISGFVSEAEAALAFAPGTRFSFRLCLSPPSFCLLVLLVSFCLSLFACGGGCLGISRHTFWSQKRESFLFFIFYLDIAVKVDV
jgi:hypothetical protein